MAGKIYPIGIQNFESLRKDGYFYVDKTALIYQMIKTGRYYFLSRPRRFGKSLLISTLEAYFQGKRELFEGLAMERLEKDWTVYPVLHLDLNTEKYDTIESLTTRLNLSLTEWEKLYGREPAEVTLSQRFEGVIKRACQKTGLRVAILVDEYDKPMLQAIGNDALQKEYRDTLKAFYGALKSRDGNIKFALLTGVTKFGKVSVFSDLNNLTDISMKQLYAELCGITEKELHANLEEELHEFAAAQETTYEAICAKLKEMYDGYHFARGTTGIYNPFSVLNAFNFHDFDSFWFATGTPTYLVELLKIHDYPLIEMGEAQATPMMLDSIDSAAVNPIPVIYQSGYLTIKSYDKRFDMYDLGFPNREVEQGFMDFLIPYYTPIDKVSTSFEISRFVREVERGEVDAFFRRLRSFFADTPYELASQRERHYQNVLYILSKLLGFYTKAEYHTSGGSIDLLLQTNDYIYVMEFKLDGTAAEALAQIEAKHYAAPFEADTRKLFKIGVNFDAATRNIGQWVVEEG